jgi:outer membrane lipoprotein-sorting protein
MSPALGNDHLALILEGIRNKYAHLPGLSLNYSREVITRSMSLLGNKVKGDLASGCISFKPPYCLRLEQKTPQGETIIANGETLWWYIPEKKRAYQYPFGEFGKELRLLSDIFRGLTEAEENFEITMVGHNEQGEYLIELRPKTPWQEIDHFVLTVTKGYDVQGVDIHNQLGSITRFTLEGLAVIGKFDKNFFHFAAPEGVELIKENYTQ